MPSPFWAFLTFQWDDHQRLAGRKIARWRTTRPQRGAPFRATAAWPSRGNAGDSLPSKPWRPHQLGWSVGFWVGFWVIVGSCWIYVLDIWWYTHLNQELVDDDQRKSEFRGFPEGTKNSVFAAKWKQDRSPLTIGHSSLQIWFADQVMIFPLKQPIVAWKIWKILYKLLDL